VEANPKPVPNDGGGNQPAGADPGDGNGGDGIAISLKGTEIADLWAKRTAWITLLAGLVYCVLFAGLAEWSRNLPFQFDKADFALFAGFIVVAGALERFMEPLLVALPPYETKAAAGADKTALAKVKEDNKRVKADRLLLAYAIALVAGILICSFFGLYFLEAIGVKIGTQEGSKWVFDGNGDKALRGLDIFITALIITGGTKPLHDMITSIEKKKDVAGKLA